MSETTERERAAFAIAMLGSLELCGISFHADLVEEGTPWEVACEPEPRFHETLTDAVRFYGELAVSETASLREQIVQIIRGAQLLEENLRQQLKKVFNDANEARERVAELERALQQMVDLYNAGANDPQSKPGEYIGEARRVLAGKESDGKS